MSLLFKDLLENPEFKQRVPWNITDYEPQEIILRKGDKGSSVYMVLDGSVLVQTDVVLCNGVTHNAGIAKLVKNEVFGELSMFDDQPHNADIIAETPCMIAKVDSQALKTYLDNNPDKGYYVMLYFIDLLVKRMRSNNVRSNSILAWYLRENSAPETECKHTTG